MRNENTPAMPIPDNTESIEDRWLIGFTKREAVLLEFAKSIVASGCDPDMPKATLRHAGLLADAYFAALEKDA